MRRIKGIPFRGLVFCCMTLFAMHAYARVNCKSTRLTRQDELQCMHREEVVKAAMATRLYQSIRRQLSAKQRILFDKNRRVWSDKANTDCALVADAFNAWGRNYARDADFQYRGCRIKIANEQIAFYQSLLCPATLETGRRPDCTALKHALR